MRELKGMEIAARCKLTFADGAWLVPSQATPGTKYRVGIGEPPSCECEDFQLRQQACKHVHAARLVAERDHGGKAPKIDTAAVPVRKTYKQVWPAYNLAQTTEKSRLRVLLHDLCRNLPDRERDKTKSGPKPHLVRDAVFAMAYKVYCGLSSRRTGTDLLEAHEQGFLTKPIHGVKVASFFEDPHFTPILTRLIAASAAPLAVVETDFAVDSSGFSSNRFERWYDAKYGVTRQKCVWVKVHVATGVKTNVVTAVRILDKDAGDSPQFKPLVDTTKERFTVKEVSADKAYASLENFEAVNDLGGTLFAAFKSNTTGAIGGIFEKMFHFFQYRREEFLQHYHKRSNVESTFSAVKRKFGDSVRSKTDVAMVNEVLAKLLCHNICCVIQEQCELGIEAIFWPEQEQLGDKPDVLPMVRPG